MFNWNFPAQDTIPKTQKSSAGSSAVQDENAETMLLTVKKEEEQDDEELRQASGFISLEFLSANILFDRIW